MEQDEFNEITDRLQEELKNANNPHEAVAWAECLQAFMVAVSIRFDLQKKLRNA